MESRAAVASALLDVGALKFDENNPFVYASGKIGPVYLDLRMLPSNPTHWSAVIDALADLVEKETRIGGFQVVSGGEVADLLFSIPVAMRLGKPHVVIRKAAKTHGLGGRIAGNLQRGQRVVHVSDLITTGASALDWITVIREAGGDLRDYFVVVDRNQGGTKALEAKGVKVIPSSPSVWGSSSSPKRKDFSKEQLESIFASTDGIKKRREGLLVGMSAGAILYVALKKAAKLGKDKTVIAVLPDGGERYLSTNLYD